MHDKTPVTPISQKLQLGKSTEGEAWSVLRKPLNNITEQITKDNIHTHSCDESSKAHGEKKEITPKFTLINNFF